MAHVGTYTRAKNRAEKMRALVERNKCILLHMYVGMSPAHTPPVEMPAQV